MEQDQISILVQSRQLHWVTRRESKQEAPAEGAEVILIITRIQDKRVEKAKIRAKSLALNLEIAQMFAQEDTLTLLIDLRKKKEALRKRIYKKRIYMSSELE